jgi:heat shock protein HtpX
VELTKNPDAMIMALRKIEGRGEIERATSEIMEMCVDNPHSGFVDLFSTHPTIERRVDALVRMAGGRDPGPLVLPPLEEPVGERLAAFEPEPPIRSGPWDRHPPKPKNPLPPWHWGPWGPYKD